jgi:hypothetical protein
MVQEIPLKSALGVSMHDGALTEEHTLLKATLIEHILLKKVDLSIAAHLLIFVKLTSETCLLLTLWVSQAKLIALSMSLVILVFPNILNHTEICLNGVDWTSFSQIVLKASLKIMLAISCRVFSWAVSLTPLNLTLELIPVAEVNDPFLCIHLVVDEASIVLRTVFENEFSKTMEDVIAYFTDVQCRSWAVKPVLTPTLHFVVLETSRILVPFLVNAATPALSFVRFPLANIGVVESAGSLLKVFVVLSGVLLRC